jgi:hypothetical protein
MVNMKARATEKTATAVGIILLGAACGQNDLSQTAVPPGEAVQGEPIESAVVQGEPISPVLPAKPVETVVVAESSVPIEPGADIAAEPVVETVVESVLPAPFETKVASIVAEAVESAVEDSNIELLAAPESEDAKAALVEVTVLEDGSLDVSFDRLASFEYEMPEDLTEEVVGETEGSSDQIPATIRDLNDKSIALKGFMLPLKVEEGLVTEMLIMRDQSMCCYGTVPKINEWVSVKMEGKGVKPVMDQAVTLFGKLKVGEIRENGYLVGIYEMDGDRMDGPTDF